MQGYRLDYSFKINHLSYGKQEDFKVIQQKFTKVGIMNPLDRLEIKAKKDDQDKASPL